MAKLYLVPTPIGNMEDITLRALRVLKEVDLILAEDTRTSSVLLKKYEISTHMESHHKFNEHKTSAGVCEKILAGMNVALISDAGTPGISDPGFLLVRTCVEGFLPVKKGRQTKFKQLALEERTMIIYESPYRLVKTLGQMVEFFGPGRMAAVCREISKMHEECRRGTVEELHKWYSAHEPKGEIVMIVSGAGYEAGEQSQDE